MSRWIALAIALVSTLVALKVGQEPGLAIAGLNAVALSMILRPGWWTFWMPLGFWEQRASDVHKADSYGPVIAFLGWVVLLLVLFLAFKIE